MFLFIYEEGVFTTLSSLNKLKFRMIRIILLLILLYSTSVVFAQFPKVDSVAGVSPESFPLEANPTDALFEIYSQKDGRSTRTTPSALFTVNGPDIEMGGGKVRLVYPSGLIRDTDIPAPVVTYIGDQLCVDGECVTVNTAGVADETLTNILLSPGFMTLEFAQGDDVNINFDISDLGIDRTYTVEGTNYFIGASLGTVLNALNETVKGAFDEINAPVLDPASSILTISLNKTNGTSSSTTVDLKPLRQYADQLTIVGAGTETDPFRSNATSTPSLRVSNSGSVFLNELSTLSTITPTTEVLVSDGPGSSKKVPFSSISSYLNVSGGSGNSISIFRANNAIIKYLGSKPAVVKVPGKLTITCDAQTIILSVDHQITSPLDANPNNTGYEVEFIYPSGVSQTLSYSGVISQSPIPITSIYTITGSSAQQDYVDSSVSANPSGLTVLFAEALPAPGAVRRLSIIF